MLSWVRVPPSMMPNPPPPPRGRASPANAAGPAPTLSQAPSSREMRSCRSTLVGVVVALGLGASSAASTVSVEAGLYELTAQTVLPHLEESLRYATTRSRLCLGTQEASALFPLLRHEAFAGCSLVHESSSEGEAHFSLRCDNPQAATGAAHFALQSGGFQAVLYIKMGGKNMTLSQRLSAPRLGACTAQ